MWYVVLTSYFCVCFFKQKTAYDLRISDWSSDVCSSDLLRQPFARGIVACRRDQGANRRLDLGLSRSPPCGFGRAARLDRGWFGAQFVHLHSRLSLSMMPIGCRTAPQVPGKDRKSTRLNSSH